jgi:hypothetical protein
VPDDIGAEFVEHVRCNVIGRTMGTVDNDLQSFQVELGRKRALAELDVAPGRVVEPLDLAKPPCFDAMPRPLEFLLDLRFDGVGQLLAAGGEELDAVVRIGIVRGADDDAGVQSQARVRYATAGVGSGPDSITSTPALENPASSAASSM